MSTLLGHGAGHLLLESLHGCKMSLLLLVERRLVLRLRLGEACRGVGQHGAPQRLHSLLPRLLRGSHRGFARFHGTAIRLLERVAVHLALVCESSLVVRLTALELLGTLAHRRRKLCLPLMRAFHSLPLALLEQVEVAGFRRLLLLAYRRNARFHRSGEVVECFRRALSFQTVLLLLVHRRLELLAQRKKLRLERAHGRLECEISLLRF
mmetsp:Transcript_2447/g.5393  ORF Transcript_2447/g.5393 Transcript_2447/m.5393 type:complete len:209 (-) Transcript_2447:100-726(-)